MTQPSLFDCGHIRKSLIRNLPFDAICRIPGNTASGRPRSGVTKLKLIAILSAVDDRDRMGRGGRGCFATVETIAADACVSVPTCRRGIKVAVAMGLLSEFHYGASRGSRCERRLIWSNIRDAIETGVLTPDLDTTASRQKLEADRSPDGSRPIVMIKPTDHHDRHNPSRESFKERNHPPMSLPGELHQNDADSAVGGDDWGDLVSDLISRGVRAAVKAVQAAQDAGATVDDIRAVIAFWDDHRASSGLTEVALYLRVRDHHRVMTPDQGWMKPAVKRSLGAQVDDSPRPQPPVVFADRGPRKPSITITAAEEAEFSTMTNRQIARCVAAHYNEQSGGVMCQAWQRLKVNPDAWRHPMIVSAIRATKGLIDNGEEESCDIEGNAFNRDEESPREKTSDKSVGQTAEPSHA